MAKLIKSYEVAEHWGIPKPTAANWSKEKDTWRAKLYKKLEDIMILDLAKQVKDM